MVVLCVEELLKPKPREGTETHRSQTLHQARLHLLLKPKPREGTETHDVVAHITERHYKLLKPKPREGTETRSRCLQSSGLKPCC